MFFVVPSHHHCCTLGCQIVEQTRAFLATTSTANGRTPGDCRFWGLRRFKCESFGTAEPHGLQRCECSSVPITWKNPQYCSDGTLTIQHHGWSGCRIPPRIQDRSCGRVSVCLCVCIMGRGCKEPDVTTVKWVKFVVNLAVGVIINKRGDG